MERKRKLPARAAARNEHAAKKRTVTPSEKGTPAPTPAPEPVPVEEPPPLPKSIQPGKPLPTVEEPQSENMPLKEYQTIKESGVMAESIRRSRYKWMTEFVFEKYWTKPVKKKGVLSEDSKNPPKDTMTKLGPVTIFIEPHVFEATLYAVKAHKPTPAPTSRPILQYGPPGGSMPPKPTTAKASPPTTSSKPRPSSNEKDGPPAPNSVPPAPERNSPALPTTAAMAPAPQDPRPQPLVPITKPANSPNPGRIVPQPPAQSPAPSGYAASPTPKPAPPGQANNAVIATLAERATSDDNLRELMKKVAEGKASKDELAQFQTVIDSIQEEHSKKGPPSPPADKVWVDGRSIKYFAEEVRTILGIVLGSNPQQRSNNLRPPPGSDALIVMLVQAALDDANLKARIHRIAAGRPEHNDTLTLKSTLDGLHKKLLADKAKGQKAAPQSPSLAPNGTTSAASGTSSQSPVQTHPTGPQALRSKGPPPPPKPDISAVVVEFAGGNGDRYLFPKFSILESRGAQQVVASFLIVRKSSRCEYGGDREADYYEPVTIRLYAQSGRYLENLARVVAPRDEVVQYMDDVMSNMTRAQYVLLAWRLMRERANEKVEDSSAETNGDAGGVNAKEGDAQAQVGASKPGVLWTAKAKQGTPSSTDNARGAGGGWAEEDEEAVQYQKLIQSAMPRDAEEA